MFMILNQSYVQRIDGCSAVLIDICGNDAIIELERGEMLKISTDAFKVQFTLQSTK